jgi:error-prone DNA polymerase
MEYVELHCHSNFSFLDGASPPDELVAVAHQLGYRALALTDHNGLYGIIRFNQAAQRMGIRPIFGAEVTLDNGHHLLLLAKDASGYANLSQLITAAKMSCQKAEARVTEEQLSTYHKGLIALSGCLKGEIPSLVLQGEGKQAERVASHYRELFGSESFYLELLHHDLPTHEVLCDKLSSLGRRLSLPCVAANNVHYATPDGRRLQDVLTCIRYHTTLDAAEALLYPNAERCLKSPVEMVRRFRRYPQAIENSEAIAAQCRFSLSTLPTSLPSFAVPEGHTSASFLRELVYQGAKERWGQLNAAQTHQLEHELTLINKLDLAGYFVIVWDIARFCRDSGILAQGRGSAANSAVCYCLGITAVDPIKLKLLFERFLSEERKEPPDIDIDIANNRREEVIQYIYHKYGRERAAMVCEVISYRGRSAVRDVGKVLGFSLEETDRLAKLMHHYSGSSELEAVITEARLNADNKRVVLLLELTLQIQKYPRHLGIHVGGMVITGRPLSEIVPIENATMPNRSVIQWDKDDAAEVGLIKIDLLGLGMLSLIDIAFKLIRQTRGLTIDPARLGYDDPKVYDLLCQAETVGVFQVESRAQMNTLPRLKPRCFYDLVVEVALIRPGPIQGEMVHPYLRRRKGEEKITYPHPSVKPILERTLGIPLFQEQGMQVAIAAAGFSPSQADELRRAMGHKRSHERMEALSLNLINGMVKNGIPQPVAMRIYKQLTAFADYGFPESHAASFASLVYVSAYLKVYFAPEFYCSLFNSQPMGFYTSASVVYEAQRRGVVILPIDVSRSKWDCTVESGKVRLGLRYVKSLGEASRGVIERELSQRPFSSIEDFVFRTGLNQGVFEQVALVGGFDCFGISRRQAMWKVLSLAGKSGNELQMETPDAGASLLPLMLPVEELTADFKGMDLSTGPHLMRFARAELTSRGVKSAIELKGIPDKRRVQVAGIVVIRQRPGTAKGFVFITLEDETGFVNVVVKPDLARQFGRVVTDSKALLVTGELQKTDGVINVIGKSFIPMEFGSADLKVKSRDFH